MKKELETMKAKLMTRLALAAAVVALGLTAQAEALYWSAYGITSSPDNTLTKSGQYYAYIFVGEKSSSSTMFQGNRVSRDAIKTMLANKEDITECAIKNASINTTGTSATYSGTGRPNTYHSSSGTTYYNNQAVGVIGKGVTVDLFAVILDGTSWTAAENYMFIEGSSLTTSYDTSAKNQIKYFDWGSQAENSWYAIGSSAVPEPTSGILLALGVAALALKRKQAA